MVLRHLKLATLGLAAAAVPVTAGVAAPPAGLSLSAAPSPVLFGKATVLAGKLTGPKADGKTVQLQADPHPFEGNFSNVGTATTDAQGRYSFAHRPSENTRYRARQGSRLSGIVTVLVRIRTSLRLSDATPKRGRRVRFSGRACPEHDGSLVRIQHRTRSGEWRTVRRTTLRNIVGSTCSSYSTRLRVFSDGSYRAVVAGDANHARGISQRRRLDVHR